MGPDELQKYLSLLEGDFPDLFDVCGSKIYDMFKILPHSDVTTTSLVNFEAKTLFFNKLTTQTSGGIYVCVTHTLKALFFILEIFSIGLALVHNDAWTEKGNIHELLKTMIIPSKRNPF